MPIESFLDYYISGVDISIRAKNAIRFAAMEYYVDSFAELLEILSKKEDWLRLRCFGKKSLNEIAEHLKTEHRIII